uniref:Uncharacterized protein n=1 Tax=Candidatus Kentrum sp. LPFa TaxID=2126335 RepID=A0A450X3F4_9GAMM|nr:MAG: hypothetical protein BECKLPF1236B_GA0070989_13791 [Candidatus Kentron sp. LPFa]
MVAVGITLMGWFLSNFRSAHWLLVAADVLALLAIGLGSYAIPSEASPQTSEA